MSALTTLFVTNLLNHYFTNAAHANIGDGTGLPGSATAGNLFYALHTADPGDGGSQSSSEVGYTGYARASAPRSSGGFLVSGKNVSPAVELSFGKRTDTGAAVTVFFWSLGTASSGAGNLILRGGIGAAPQPFTAATTDSITSPGHGLSMNDRVVFWQYESIALPTGITEGTVYFVNSVSGDTFTISTTQGGGNVDITAAGQGTCQKITPLTITQNVTPKLETGTVIKFQ